MSSKKLDSTTSDFFYENLEQLALRLKRSNDNSKKEFIKNMKSEDFVPKAKGPKTYNRKKQKVKEIYFFFADSLSGIQNNVMSSRL